MQQEYDADQARSLTVKSFNRENKKLYNSVKSELFNHINTVINTGRFSTVCSTKDSIPAPVAQAIIIHLQSLGYYASVDLVNYGAPRWVIDWGFINE